MNGPQYGWNRWSILVGRRRYTYHHCHRLALTTQWWGRADWLDWDKWKDETCVHISVCTCGCVWERKQCLRKYFPHSVLRSEEGFALSSSGLEHYYGSSGRMEGCRKREGGRGDKKEMAAAFKLMFLSWYATHSWSQSSKHRLETISCCINCTL